MTHYENRVEGAKKAIDKLEKKIDRINKALKTGKNPYMYDERDLKSANKDLAEKQQKLKEYTAKVEAEQSVQHVPAIERFLDEWKLKAYEWHKKDYKNLVEYYLERKKKLQEIETWKEEQFGRGYSNSIRKQVIEKEKEYGVDRKTHENNLKKRFNNLTVSIVNSNNWEEQLDELLEKEKDAKRQILIERVSEMTGHITDASGLRVGNNGEINGIVVGVKGKASVETISAGGWNIQRFHYRVFVREARDQ